MKLKHHAFRFGLIGNLKVLLCRIFGHRVSDDPTGFACQRCRLAYEEIYSPGYWANMLEWFGSDDRDDDVEISMPILDGSEMIGEETVDEYLDRIVAQKGKENPFAVSKDVLDGMLGIGGIPSNEEFCEELIARLCDAFGLVDFTGLKWKEGAPEQEGWYIWVDKHYPTRTLGYWEPRTFWPSAILYHIGPIPPVPQNDAE